MKRIVLTLMVAGLLVGLAGGQAGARALAGPEDTAQIGFSQDVYDVTVGDDFTVGVMVAGAEELGGWEATLTYASSAVLPTGASAGTFLITTGREAALLGPNGDPGSSRVALGGYSWGTPNGVSGDGTIAQVELHAVAAGTFVLALTDTVLASVHGATVTMQPVEAHTAQVNFYAAPSAPMATIARDGAGVGITWQHAAANASYQVWRSNLPYFVPGEGDSRVIAGEGLFPGDHCSWDGATITCNDPDPFMGPGGVFYVVRSLNGAGAGATSPRMGVFVFPVQSGN